MRAGRSIILAAALTTAVVASRDVAAHRRDEYLQAARLAVEPDRAELELDLTPGIAVADATIADLDRDRDGALSEEEKHAFSDRAIGAIALELDGLPLHVETIGSTFPALNDFRRGEGTIQLRAQVALIPRADGDHHLLFRNRNQPEGSVYLANALVPTNDRIVITAQRRDPTQGELTIDYVVRSRTVTPAPAWLLSALTGVAVLAAVLLRPSRSA